MHHHGLITALLLIPLTLLAACSATGPAQTSSQAPGQKPGQQCTWTCKRWEKSCNIDPRGVYTCRRQCADFGQVCE